MTCARFSREAPRLPFVIPAHAGIHGPGAAGDSAPPRRPASVDPGFRRDDERGETPIRPPTPSPRP
ncbi:MAG: hypothetical protein EKK50_04240 [Sphingomonadaceae bacterium]|nr:MAG: hypothetical protein EKK50_04240 [Sphingomonadaceae bacterium]